MSRVAGLVQWLYPAPSRAASGLSGLHRHWNNHDIRRRITAFIHRKARYWGESSCRGIQSKAGDGAVGLVDDVEKMSGGIDGHAEWMRSGGNISNGCEIAGIDVEDGNCAGLH